METSATDMLLFELAERVTRLLSHVQLSRQIASRHAPRLGAQDNAAAKAKAVLVQSFEVLRLAAALPETDVSEPDAALNRVKQFVDGFHMLMLQYIPRPYEPVELLSFIRQVSQRGTYLPPIPIFAAEELHNSCFSIDPLEQMAEKMTALANGLREGGPGVLSVFADRLEHRAQSTDRSHEGYISIPRADLNYPCSWPSVLHELHHQSNEVTGEALRDELKGQMGDEAYSHLLSACKLWILPVASQEVDAEKCLSDWLLECWCDCAGIKALGPSIWFSQLHAFLFSPGYLAYDRPLFLGSRKASYPPASIRLKVLRSVLKNRYAVIDQTLSSQIFEFIDDYQKKLLPLFSNRQSSLQPAAALVQTVIGQFLSRKFADSDMGGSDSISFTEVGDLVESLGKGEPIPTVGNDPFNARGASIGEILLAGWLSRLRSHRDSVLSALKDQAKTAAECLEYIQRMVNRFDESLKRSIQVREWMDVLGSDSTETVAHASTSNALSSESVLANSSILMAKAQICEALKSGEVRIIPLVNPNLQISGTSVDIRLGHNFEVFFPGARGVIDEVAAENLFDTDQSESMDVQIDLGQGITIHPGQFILAHTLEYLRLPRHVAAQIEGRSSFARLGLQVHMTANLVEAGFEGSLTLEIANVGPTAIKLYPGTRIGQVRLFSLAVPSGTSADAGSGQPAPKYQGLLSQNKARQGFDPEVRKLRDLRSAAKSRDERREDGQ